MPTKLLILITISSENIIIEKNINNHLALVKLYIYVHRMVFLKFKSPSA